MLLENFMNLLPQGLLLLKLDQEEVLAEALLLKEGLFFLPDFPSPGLQSLGLATKGGVIEVLPSTSRGSVEPPSYETSTRMVKALPLINNLLSMRIVHKIPSFFEIKTLPTIHRLDEYGLWQLWLW